MKQRITKRLYITIGIAAILLSAIYSVALYVPLARYTGYSLCGANEKYYVMSGEIDEYDSRVKFFKAYDDRLDPDGDGSGAGPAVVCASDGKISLYLL